MKILAFDTSTVTGFAWMDLETGEIIDYGNFRIAIPEHSLEKAGPALVKYEEEVKKLLKRYPVDFVAVEVLVSFMNAKTTRLLAILMGIVIQSTYEVLKIDTQFVYPISAKVAVLGNMKRKDEFGNKVKMQVKKEVLMKVNLLYNLQLKPGADEDISDAISVARKIWIEYKEGKAIRKGQEEIF